jgi:hypothetical protein
MIIFFKQGNRLSFLIAQEENSKMTTLKYVGKLIIDSTGPLRKIRLPDGLYVVGEQMLIAVDSEEEADDVIKQLKRDLGQE